MLIILIISKIVNGLQSNVRNVSLKISVKWIYLSIYKIVNIISKNVHIANKMLLLEIS